MQNDYFFSTTNTKMVISVSEILKQANKQEEDAKQSVHVKRLTDLVFDLRHLAAFDPIKYDLSKTDKEDFFKQITRDSTQLLVNQIWNHNGSDNVAAGQLPLASSYHLPRAKSVPKQRLATKWETFAKAKGIQKKKKDKLIWDKVSQAWKPRYGYRGVNQDQNKWLIEVPDNAEPNVDYFEKNSEAKKERVAKNELQRLRNISRSTKIKFSGTSGLLPDLEPGRKQEFVHAKALAKSATASMGKFQSALPEEKGHAERSNFKKHPFESNFKKSLVVEKQRHLELMEQILKNKKQSNNDEKIEKKVSNKKTKKKTIKR